MGRWSRRLYNKKLPPKPVRPWQVRIEEGGVEPPVLAYSNYPRARAAAEKACPGFRGIGSHCFMPPMKAGGSQSLPAAMI